VPTPYNFLARFLKAAGACRDKEVLLYASYLTELALPDYAMLRFSYSQTAAAAVYVANRCASPHTQNRELLKFIWIIRIEENPIFGVLYPPMILL